MEVQEAATKALGFGLSVLPITPGTKKAACQWSEFQTRLMRSDEVQTLFTEGVGIAAVCGAASGNLECIDFDNAGSHYGLWVGLVEQHGGAEALARCYVQFTPSGGRHVVYRCEVPVEGNQRLASGKGKVWIETRGEGGYFLIWPSTGYKPERGRSLAKIPVLTADERDLFLSCARYLSTDEMRQISDPTQAIGSDRPGDDYNRRASWSDILLASGWAQGRKHGQGGHEWVRPGKNARDGIGATTGNGPKDLLWVFTSNAPPFEPSRSYSKFAAYAMLHHNGNYSEASKALLKQGYGKESSPKSHDYTQPNGRLPVDSDAERKSQKWVRGAGVTVQSVEWLWEPYVPRGEVTFLAGDPGVGKSTLAQAIASSVTLGADLLGRKVPQGDVIFMSAEQSMSRVTVPRFRDMGADLFRVVMPDDETEDEATGEAILHPFVLDKHGMAELMEQAKEIRPALIVVDTVTKYFEASRDFNTANQVREWMARLITIIRAVDAACIVVGHTNKATGMKAIHRISGSVDFVGASRSVLMAGKDPIQDGHYVMAHEKSNVGPIGAPLGYSLENGVFGWTGVCDTRADELFEAPVTRADLEKRQECAEWLRDYLANGAVQSSQLDKEAKAQGYSDRILRDAKRIAGAVKSRDSFSGAGRGAGAWQWSIPSNDAQKEAWWNK